MKKIGLICASMIACLSLAACGNQTTSHTSSSAKTTQVHKKYYFDGKVANLKDEKIKIDKVSFYKGDESSNNKNLIVFDYTITNKSDKDIDAISGWQAVFNAYQDNKNTEGKLEVGSLPNDTSEEILNNQDQIIKKGGSVKCRAAYQLDSNSKPVVLKAVKGYDKKFLGKKTFKIRKFKTAELKSSQTQASSTSSSSQGNLNGNTSGSQKQTSTAAERRDRGEDPFPNKGMWSYAQDENNWQGTGDFEHLSPEVRYSVMESAQQGN